MFAVAVAAAMIGADLAACSALLAWRAWRRRRPTRLARLLADHDADEFDAIIRAVTDNDGKAL